MKQVVTKHQRVHTRKIDRGVAHALMKKGGIVQPNKGKPSFFSQNWQDTKYLN